MYRFEQSRETSTGMNPSMSAGELVTEKEGWDVRRTDAKGSRPPNPPHSQRADRRRARTNTVPRPERQELEPRLLKTLATLAAQGLPDPGRQSRRSYRLVAASTKPASRLSGRDLLVTAEPCPWHYIPFAHAAAILASMHNRFSGCAPSQFSAAPSKLPTSLELLDPAGE